MINPIVMAEEAAQTRFKESNDPDFNRFLSERAKNYYLPRVTAMAEEIAMELSRFGVCTLQYVLDSRFLTNVDFKPAPGEETAWVECVDPTRVAFLPRVKN